MKYIWVVFPVIIALWLVYGFAVANTSDTWVVSGQFGDMFGAFTALVSGLAFAGIIIAILLQRQDLELQREELRLQRQELARPAEALEQQIGTERLTAQLTARASLISFYANRRYGASVRGPSDADRASFHSEVLEETLLIMGQQANSGDETTPIRPW